jgi:hypothetical protein
MMNKTWNMVMEDEIKRLPSGESPLLLENGRMG